MTPFARTALLLGQQAIERLATCRVALFGLGGVGSFTAEALARAGIGQMTLVDGDCVSPSNLNRQLVALHSTLGVPKVAVMAARIRDINPLAQVEPLERFYLPENADTLDLAHFDYVVDAVDMVVAKVALAVRAKEAGVPLISCMGAGNKLDPTRFEVEDLFKTEVCPLCKVMRRELRQHGVTALKVVYSREPPRRPSADTQTSDSPAGRVPTGSVSFVPSVAGLLLAAEVVRDLIDSQQQTQ